MRAALGLDRLHLFGSSWGGMLAMQYVLDRQPDLVSLTLCGSPASMIRWVSDCAELLKEEPEEVLRTIREHEDAGFTACPEYQAAILGFYRKHVCRLDPWPAGFERSFAEAGYGVAHTMNGPSEFTVTGTLKTWDVMHRLGEIRVPTLVVGGRYDECTPATCRRSTAVSPPRSSRSSRMRPTCALPSSQPSSPRSSTPFLTERTLVPAPIRFSQSI
ncbi:MAG: alpha/beta fold hydrolase [Streptosporangiaceae bacterium]